MPLRCSSSSRSVSVPVMRRTSVVLPWSTCPAVPMVRAIRPSPSANGGLHGGDDLSRVARQEGPRVEAEPPLAHPPNDRRVGEAQRFREGFRICTAEADGEGGNLVQGQRPAAAAGNGGRDVHLE